MAARISRRRFLDAGIKLAAAAGIAGPWTGEPFGSAPWDERSALSSRRPEPGAAGAGFFGVQTHFGQFRSDVDELLDLIKEAGIGWIRDEVYWSEIEKEKGVFRFPPEYDRYLRAARARGLRVLLILDFGNALYSSGEKGGPATEPERQAFARYCREVIKRCGPLGVRHYEVWNEPNASTFWRPRPDPGDYAALLRSAYLACKEADPGSTVLGCSTSGADLDFIGKVFAAGGGPYMDAVSFHPYCQPLAPEQRLLTGISKVVNVAPGKPLWITEFGYATHAGASGVDEETQADYLVRAFLLARTVPAVERLFWYDFQNDGRDPGEAEFNFGLVRTDRAGKPSYAACKTMASLINGLSLAGFEIVGNTYILRFGEGNSPLFAVWRSGGTEAAWLTCPKGVYRIVERDGESSTVESKGLSLEVTASEKPRYVLKESSTAA